MRILIACLITVWLPSWVLADFAAGLAAYRSEDYRGALREWQPLADDGMAEAQFNLGLLYAQGNGVERDRAAAAAWYLKAAEQGLARAQFRLAEAFETGDGVPADDVQAYYWFKVASLKKHPQAKKRRRKVADRMTPYDIAQAELLVRLWKRER